MRSRAVRRLLLCWFSIAFVPPPSQIFSPSLRTWDIRSARKRMLASKRADVGSTFVVKTVPEAKEFAARVSLRFDMEEWTDYGITAGRNGAMQRRLETSPERRLGARRFRPMFERFDESPRREEPARLPQLALFGELA